MRSDTRSRRAVLIGLAAATGAFGAAAMVSAATAPSARADDLAAIISDIQTTEGFGQAAYTTALADFGSNHLSAGFTQLFNAVNDDSLGVPGIAYIGGVEELTNESFSLSPSFFDFNLDAAPTSFANAVSDVQTLFALGESDLAAVSTALAAGDYGGAATDGYAASLLIFDLPVQELLLGGLVSLGL